MKKKKKIIIIISIIVGVIIACGVFAYLFIKTDLFKSNQELFGKYITQSVEQFQKITDLQIVDEYKQIGSENKYESNTNIKFVSSEGGEISNPLNKLTAKLNIQKDSENQYLYGDGQILFEDEEYLRAELIKELDVYGIRFSDVVKQFVTIKNDENIETIANSIGIEASVLERIINFVDGNNQIISNEQTQNFISKYLEILKQEIQKGNFTKQKDATITYNNITTNTNAYQVYLTNEQVENALIEIFNNLKNETELLSQIPMMGEGKTEFFEQIITTLDGNVDIPTLKITVFEQKQLTLRTIVEIGDYKITIDNVNENGEIKNIIHLMDLNSDEGIEYNIEIVKSNVENQEKLEIAINMLGNEENNSISFEVQTNITESLKELDFSMNYEQGIMFNSIIIENDINIGNDYEYAKVVDTDENMLLNDLDTEKRQFIIDYLNQKVPVVTSERLNLLLSKIGWSNDGMLQENQDEGEQQESEENPQIEINRFNSKFEFYTGDEVSAENVKKLLDVVKNNVSGHEIMNLNIEENSKASITLYIEKDKTNEESITKALEVIKDKKKYKISITYNDTNNLIKSITINEI